MRHYIAHHEPLGRDIRDTHPTRPVAEVAMRRLLGIRDGRSHVDEPAARWVAGTSLLISATRCLLELYRICVHGTSDWPRHRNPVLGISPSLIALVANVVAARRFWRADHRWRWPYTAFCAVVMGMLSVLFVRDVISVFG
jgi:hypothetical protein